MLPDPTLSLGHPFLFRYSLSFLTHPLKSTHIHTDTTPLLRQQVKQNNSLCHTIAPLPRSRHWLLYSMTFPPLSLFSAPSSSLVLYFFFPYHRNSATTRASDGELLDLSHCVVVLCCVVLCRLVSAPYIKRGLLLWTPLFGGNWRCCVCITSLCTDICQHLDLSKFSVMMHHVNILKKCLYFLGKDRHSIEAGKKAFFKTQFYCTKCFIVFTKYI